MSGNGWSNEAINLDGVSTEFVPPDPVEGIVVGVIEKAEPRLTKSGKPSVSLTLKATGHYQGAEFERSMKVFDNSVILDASFRLKQLVESTGVEAPEVASKEAAEEFCAQLQGVEVIFRARIEEWKGKNKTAVDRYLTAEQAQEALEAAEGADELPRRGRRTA